MINFCVMANEEQLAMLKRSVEEWNGWRKINENVHLDLRNAHIWNTNLEGAYLRNVDFFSANLSDTNLRSANLSYAYLSYADLSDANLNSTDLSNSNLRSADLRSADLSDANLSKANLCSANLRFADLRDTNLCDADFRDANLRDANLFGADFRDANLRDANLRDANLRGANLSGADLSGADLRSADLSGVNFDKTVFRITNIDNVDLKLAKSLESINHRGNSSISTQTFIKNEGQIPKILLQGIGLSDWEIEAVKLYQPNLTPTQIVDIVYEIDHLRNKTPIQLYPVFLSHSHKDKPFTRKLHDALNAHGVRSWLDEKKLLPGDDILKSIDKGINVYDKMILICSKDSLDAWWVNRELDRILEKEKELNDGKPEAEQVRLLIPIMLDDYILSDWKSSRKKEITRYFIGDFQGWKKEDQFDQAVEELVKALRVNGPGFEPRSVL